MYYHRDICIDARRRLLYIYILYDDDDDDVKFIVYKGLGNSLTLRGFPPLRQQPDLHHLHTQHKKPVVSKPFEIARVTNSLPHITTASNMPSLAPQLKPICYSLQLSPGRCPLIPPSMQPRYTSFITIQAGPSMFAISLHHHIFIYI